MAGKTTGFHVRYLYRDYLQVAECDLTGETPVLVRSYLWDPSEPEATRVLTVTAPGRERDANKRSSLLHARDDEKRYLPLRGSVYDRRALYEYRPYGGLITSEDNMGDENGFRFSSEYMDDELGRVYHSIHRS
ncbi:hypothetical protein [Akkermansia sp.]|uniref:hypothetical protein n=1 Tax=Akkermansia sp. TaxID=1872421 RepID=UPI0025C013F7|nr:hypothetical protein [Akkermansia sp.]MCD8271491.1 hypothetical protein [Akkermansia sp.]